MACCINQLRL